MPGEIIKKLTDAEKLSQERERAARSEREAIITEAKNRAQQIVSEAEAEGKRLIEKAEADARTGAEKFRAESEAALKKTIAALKSSAENNAERAEREIIRIISN